MTDGGKVKITELDGTYPINMAPVSGDTSVTIDTVKRTATKKLKVTYTEAGVSRETTYDIKILDELADIAELTPATNVFDHGDAFGTGSGTFTAMYRFVDPQTIDTDDGVLTDSGTLVTSRK